MNTLLGTKRRQSLEAGDDPGPALKRLRITDDITMTTTSNALKDVEMEGVASTEAKDTADARTLARKPRKHVKRGAWSLMMQMPLEVLEKIFDSMTPRELLRLSRVDKAIRRAVLTMWNPRAFIAARANFDNAPAPPEGMSEPEYASYISEKICSVCGGTAVFVEPMLRVRACSKHLEDKAVILVRGYNQHLGSPLYTDEWTIPSWQDVMSGVLFKLYNNRKWASIADVREYVDSWRVAKEQPIPPRTLDYVYRPPPVIQFTWDRRQNKKDTKTFDEWRERTRKTRLELIKTTVEERKATINERLLAMGHPQSDLEFNNRFPMNNEWASLCNQPSAVTDEHWERVLPHIKVIMEARAKARALRQKQGEKIVRRGFVERTILTVLREEVDHEPWGENTDADADAEEKTKKKNVMKPLLHAIVPQIDIMPLARSFVKGHTSKPPSHQAVMAEAQSVTRLHILRVRASLAKMVRATDQLRQSAPSSPHTVALGPEALAEIETSVQTMTLEELVQGDTDAKRLLFHPTAFFRARNVIDPSKLASEDPTPEYLRKSWAKPDPPCKSGYSITEVSAKYFPANPLSVHSKTLGGQTVLSNSARSFYPAVFKDSKRPSGTSVQAREVQVDAVMRETAEWLLAKAEPPLDAQVVLENALSNAMCFSCVKCGKCKGTRYDMMTWTQLVAHYADLQDHHPNPIDLFPVPAKYNRAALVLLHQRDSTPNISMKTESELKKCKYILAGWNETGKREGPHGYGCCCAILSRDYMISIGWEPLPVVPT